MSKVMDLHFSPVSEEDKNARLNIAKRDVERLRERIAAVTGETLAVAATTRTKWRPALEAAPTPRE